MPSRKKFVASFLIFAVIFMAFGFIFVSYSDPFRNLDMPWRSECSYHKNDALRKFELMEASPDAEAVVIGASTSEPYGTKEISELFGVKTFNASVAGSDTTTRLVLLKKALDTFKNLKYVFYISDLYEYNHPESNTLTYYQKQLAPLIPEDVRAISRPNFKLRVYDVYSHQSFESASANFKDCFRGHRKEYYLPDGMTTRSVVISAGDKLKTNDPAYEQKLEQAFIKAINLHAATMNGMTKLSPVVERLMTEAVDQVKKRDVQMFIILSPYNPKFIPILEKKGLVGLRKEWREFIHGLAADKVRVFDYEDNPPFDSSGNFWKDGHHYRSEAAYLILQDIAAKSLKKP